MAISGGVMNQAFCNEYLLTILTRSKENKVITDWLFNIAHIDEDTV